MLTKMQFPNKPRGTQDIYFPLSLIYQKIQQLAVQILLRNNYQPIIFPTFENEGLFSSSLGSTSDIVHKEMYKFFDQKGRKLVLRPEGTASVARLVYQNKLIKNNCPLKLYYWSNMFRYERPQKGRYREFWQLGVELINTEGELADYQILKLAYDILFNLKVKGLVFSLNYLGGIKTREKYKKILKEFIEVNNPNLCENCQKRRETNLLRILDCLSCKEKNNYPSYEKAWSNEDRDYVNNLNQILDKFNFPYQYNYCLVRGLDYYTGLIFEIDPGDKKVILGGGRYDKLHQKKASENVPATGFAIGIERLINYLEDSKTTCDFLKVDNRIDVFFLVSFSKIYYEVLAWKQELERYLLRVEYNLEIKKKKSLFKIISYYQPRLVVILEKETRKKKVLIEDYQKKKKFWVNKKKIIKWIQSYSIKKNWD